MEQWSTLVDVLLLLSAALVLGALCERLRQSAIIGYLLAGTLLGPNALQIVGTSENVEALAELGVALLLFTIGLEFSWRRLRQLGPTALGGGAVQVVLTMALAGAAGMILGLGFRPAVAVGAMIALSSTACVLRILVTRAEIDSPYGRDSLGILLIQDIAIVPLVLIVSVLSGGGTAWSMMLEVGQTILLAAALIAAFLVLFNYVVPIILGTGPMQRNRELPTLMAIVVGLGSAWAAHRLHLSPALGAFVAGMLLAESPYATQIRADVTSLRTLLTTLFFSSIGMLGDPAWILQNIPSVAGLVVAIVVGKALLIWFILRRFGQSHPNALAAGLCLAQVGEFSFVLAQVAREGTLIDEDLFRLVVSSTIVTLFITPYLIVIAPSVAGRTILWLEKATGGRLLRAAPSPPRTDDSVREGEVLIIGFGPAGQRVAETLIGQTELVTVLDLSKRNVETARRMGFHAHVGDASHPTVLEHLPLRGTVAVVITVPDPGGARKVIAAVRSVAPQARILARARYHIFRWELEAAGADAVVDEEYQVGQRLAAEVRKTLRVPPPTTPEHELYPMERE